MFDYLFFGTVFLWYKDKDSLQKLLSAMSWIGGILYARAKSSSYFEAVQNFLIGLPVSKNPLIYVVKEDNTPIPIDIKHVKESDSNRFYVRTPKDKIIVFTDKNTLINMYDSILCLSEKHRETFSNIMDAIVGDKDVLPVLKKYTSNNCYYTDITGYKLKAGDLYDFDANRYVLEEGELSITNMSLDTKTYNKEDELE
jgi:hypothetical protein